MFSKNVRKRRLNLGWSLEMLSSKSQVSRAMLSKIERNEKQPTLKIAAQIAEALESSISELLGEKQNERIIKIEAKKHLKYIDPESGFERELLSPNIDSKIELIKNKIPISQSSGVFPAHTVGVKEYIYILTGQLRVRLIEKEQVQEFKLNEGDSFYFEAHKQHEFINEYEGEAQYILVIDSNC
ncbi:helix-turn-helix domain-containing protein [Staphylococcus pseudintermedius]|nr:helix-turn-helix domain-containing protein [Staphylococcus pseudintermedius]